MPDHRFQRGPALRRWVVSLVDMHFTYIIRSLKTGRYYIGSTNDVPERLSRHNGGKNKSTKSGVPWELVKVEEYGTRQEAYKREFQIKSYKGGEAFKKLIN